MKTYEEMALKVDEISCDLYSLFKELEAYCGENMKPDEPQTDICFLVKETLRNMSFTLDTMADVMLGNQP